MLPYVFATCLLVYTGSLQQITTSALGVLTVGNDDQRSDGSESGVPTLGGRQFWGDVCFCHGWRIQENALDGHFRLLSPNDKRYASGSREQCRAKLEEILDSRKLGSMSGDAVILIHGIGRSSKSFAEMSKALSDLGYTVVGFDYPSTQVSIPDCAEYLHEVVRSLEGIGNIDLVCHSMGGLVLRAYLMKHQGRRFRRAVMLGVPNKGAKMADMLKRIPIYKMVLGPAGQQLVSNPDGLIDKLPTPEFEFGVLAGGRNAAKGFNPMLKGDNDLTVTVSSTRLAGAADFLLIPVLHSFLMSKEEGISATTHFLQHGRFKADRPATPIRDDDISIVK